MLQAFSTGSGLTRLRGSPDLMSAAMSGWWRSAGSAPGADGALPVLRQVREEARRRKIDLVVLPTAEAIGVLAQTTRDTNAILHLTC
jgi:hypothetical protein